MEYYIVLTGNNKVVAGIIPGDQPWSGWQLCHGFKSAKEAFDWAVSNDYDLSLYTG